MADFIALEFKKTKRTRKWSRAATMHRDGLGNLKKTAEALTVQDGWANWRIVCERTGAILENS